MKICGDCKTEKDFSQFNKKGNGYQSRCRDCQKIWYKDYYSSSSKEKDRLFKKNTDSKNICRDIIRQAKDVPCTDCGINYPYYVMDFDHLPEYDKISHIGRMVSSGNVSALETEIKKCEVVCSNCHRIRTFERNNYPLV